MKSFIKYQASGNDFVLFDEEIELQAKQIQQICHRRFGIGADGVLILTRIEGCDRRMRIYNPDGKEATMCGNGLRACFQYLKEKENLRSMCIQSAHHLHRADTAHDQIKVDMGPYSDFQKLNSTCFFVYTGAAHLVKIVENLEFNIEKEAKKLQQEHQHLGLFNVNFIKVAHNEIAIRTYEKGVDGETFACATGAMAAAIIVQSLTKLQKFQVVPISKDPLFVELTPSRAFVTGRAVRVFEGTTSLISEKNLV